MNARCRRPSQLGSDGSSAATIGRHVSERSHEGYSVTTSSSSRAGLALATIAALLVGPVPALAGDTKVTTNQSYIEDAMVEPEFAIGDKLAVLRLVLNSLPDKVKVYPTENYFYFYFNYLGAKYAGNLRFDVEDRDKGLVHFTYFKDFTVWQHDEQDFGGVLGTKDGVLIKPAGKLAYEVTFEGRHIVFQLNDLSEVKPPDGLVGKDETYIGPVFDESGIRFFLVFHRKAKTFHFILDETRPEPDQFNQVGKSSRLTIGVRTGFAFYEDRFANRKILVGVNQNNTWVNNYLDGPFDQLPDNFIKGDLLQQAILQESPDAKGQIDRLGNYADGERRYLIAPYMQYENDSDLKVISDCARRRSPPRYYKCFSYGGEEANRR